MTVSQPKSITEITYRDIRHALMRERIWWSGDLEETAFLNRLFNLAAMPSTDSRFKDAQGDICQHRILNPEDWDDDWIFEDERFQLSDGPDEVLLTFLAEMVHPAVRRDRDQVQKCVGLLNELLLPDGWALVETSRISGRPVYSAQRITTSQHAIDSAKAIAEVLDADYVHRQINRMVTAIDSDPELAIGTAKELIETCCHTILAGNGQPMTEKLELHPLVRRTMEHLRLVPDGIDDEQKGAKAIKSLLGNLATITQSLAELRNLYGTGHGKHRERRGISGRHARLAVGAATTLALFLFDTHQERISAGQPPIAN